jgi:hypothetical protein
MCTQFVHYRSLQKDEPPNLQLDLIEVRLNDKGAAVHRSEANASM